MDVGQRREPESNLWFYIEEIKTLGIRVSLFMDADKEQISLAKQIGADRIETE